MVICQIFTLLRVRGFEFGIPNQYIDFKIALDTVLEVFGGMLNS